MDLRRLRGQQFLDAAWPLSLTSPFTAKVAIGAGIKPHELRWLVAHGYLTHLLHGVYVAAQVPDSTKLRCEALGIVVPEDCVVVDRHAGWLHGAQMILAPNEHVNLRPISMFRPSGNGRLRNDLASSGERNLRPADIVEVHGLRVSTPIRTAWDLGRVRWPSEAIAGLDAMLALGAFSKDELLEGIERFKGMRWVTVLRAIAPLADHRSQSPGESVLRLRWIEAHLPEAHPQLQVWRGTKLIGILDLATAEWLYAAEYDGVEWHSSPEQTAHDRRRRQEMGEEGWLIDVFTATDLWGRQADAETRLRRGGEAAHRRFAVKAS